MSYQPRRVAELGEVPADETTIEHAAPAVARRAAISLSDRIFHRSGAVIAVVTAVAATAAVAIGASGGQTAAAIAPVSASAGPLVADTLVLTKSATLTTKTGTSAVAVSRQYTTGSLNVRAEADVKSELLGRLSSAVRVEATAELKGDYRKVIYEDSYGWVLADELSDSDSSAVPEGTSMEPCSRGSAVENKLRQATIFIYRSVCPLYPAVNSYGGWRAGGMQFHKNGRALDIMLTPHAESALGHRIANYLIAHASLFKIDHIIFEQHIWTPSTPHWRKMADRGSLNANHFNHVHVAVVASAR
jgi:hypothetical protein